jgi:hypothetical protein
VTIHCSLVLWINAVVHKTIRDKRYAFLSIETNAKEAGLTHFYEYMYSQLTPAETRSNLFRNKAPDSRSCITCDALIPPLCLLQKADARSNLGTHLEAQGFHNAYYCYLEMFKNQPETAGEYRSFLEPHLGCL